MIVIDFEVFAYDWLCVMYDVNKDRWHIVHNDRARLDRLFSAYRYSVFVGYNIRGYDQWIMKAILTGEDPKAVNDFIIEQGRNGASYSNKFARIPLCFFDVQTTQDGLKKLEGFMGASIKETSVPFDLPRPLNVHETDQVVAYCKYDVFATFNVLKLRIADYRSQLELCTEFNLGRSAMGITKTQLAALVLNARKRNYNDEFDYDIPANVQIQRYKHVLEWFRAHINGGPAIYHETLQTNVASIPHVFAWGGVHGSLDNSHIKGPLVNCDVASYYPSLMLEYGLMSRSIKDPSLYADIYHRRLEYKAAKDKRANAYKLVLNSVYGALKDVHNALYDPRQANRVCVYGQLFLLDLIEHVESAGCAVPVNTNTDGVLFLLKEDTDACRAALKAVCDEWQQRTRMVLEFDEYCELWQKDVNNYILIDRNGDYKSKGAFVKKLSPLDNDLPIVNRALVEYMVHGVPIEQTVNGSQDLMDFQQIFKVSNKYVAAQHNGRQFAETTFRVFASTRYTDGPLYKLKNKEGTLVPEKFANCPDHCFIENGEVDGKPIPKVLDRAYYIELAKHRLDGFGGSNRGLF